MAKKELRLRSKVEIQKRADLLKNFAVTSEVLSKMGLTNCSNANQEPAVITVVWH